MVVDAGGGGEELETKTREASETGERGKRGNKAGERSGEVGCACVGLAWPARLWPACPGRGWLVSCVPRACGVGETAPAWSACVDRVGGASPRIAAQRRGKIGKVSDADGPGIVAGSSPLEIWASYGPTVRQLRHQPSIPEPSIFQSDMGCGCGLLRTSCLLD